MHHCSIKWAVFLLSLTRLITIGAVRYPWRYQPGDDFIVLAGSR